VILALETATTVASIAIIDKDKVLGEIFLNTRKNHSEVLMPMVDKLLKFINREITDMEAFAVAIGPGSFTGLRIGLATAKGMAQALKKPVIGVPTLDGLARNLIDVNGLICPILDARKNEVYTAVYSCHEHVCERITDYMALSPQQLGERFAQFGEEITILGDAVLPFGQLLINGKSSISIASQANCFPRAAQIGAIAQERLERGESNDLFELAPLYIRRSEAEIRWEEKHDSLRDQ